MTTSKLITKRDLRKVFFRSFPMEWTWNYEKQQKYVLQNYQNKGRE